MEKKIVQMLHLALEPVGIFLGNTSAKGDTSQNKKINSDDVFVF